MPLSNWDCISTCSGQRLVRHSVLCPFYANLLFYILLGNRTLFFWRPGSPIPKASLLLYTQTLDIWNWRWKTSVWLQMSCMFMNCLYSGNKLHGAHLRYLKLIYYPNANNLIHIYVMLVILTRILVHADTIISVNITYLRFCISAPRDFIVLGHCYVLKIFKKHVCI